MRPRDLSTLSTASPVLPVHLTPMCSSALRLRGSAPVPPALRLLAARDFGRKCASIAACAARTSSSFARPRVSDGTRLNSSSVLQQPV